MDESTPQPVDEMPAEAAVMPESSGGDGDVDAPRRYRRYRRPEMPTYFGFRFRTLLDIGYMSFLFGLIYYLLRFVYHMDTTILFVCLPVYMMYVVITRGSRVHACNTSCVLRDGGTTTEIVDIYYMVQKYVITG